MKISFTVPSDCSAPGPKDTATWSVPRVGDHVEIWSRYMVRGMLQCHDLLVTRVCYKPDEDAVLVILDHDIG